MDVCISASATADTWTEYINTQMLLVIWKLVLLAAGGRSTVGGSDLK